MQEQAAAAGWRSRMQEQAAEALLSGFKFQVSFSIFHFVIAAIERPFCCRSHTRTNPLR
jgi:hypothetical protein